MRVEAYGHALIRIVQCSAMQCMLSTHLFVRVGRGGQQATAGARMRGQCIALQHIPALAWHRMASMAHPRHRQHCLRKTRSGLEKSWGSALEGMSSVSCRHHQRIIQHAAPAPLHLMRNRSLIMFMTGMPRVRVRVRACTCQMHMQLHMHIHARVPRTDTEKGREREEHSRALGSTDSAERRGARGRGAHRAGAGGQGRREHGARCTLALSGPTPPTDQGTAC